MGPRGGTKLGAKWQLDAALLSRPVDLTALVSLSQTSPDDFFHDDTLSRMVKLLLNAVDDTRSDKDTRLDVLTVLSNLAGAVSEDDRLEQIKMALDGINEWFDEYMAREEARIAEGTTATEVEPELHKLMLLLLARLYGYKLKTEDLLELVRSDKILGLETVVGLLEDGETYTTELHRKQAPSLGRMGQWEHKLVCHRHEKPLILQLCRLRGFTLPQSYFGTASDGAEISEHDVNEFTNEMNLLLDITIKSRLVEKLALACHECLFAPFDGNPDEGPRSPSEPSEASTSLVDDDHKSIACVHSFLQNMYFYATNRTLDYRQHLLADTLLIPRLVLPYLDRSVQRASQLNARAEAYRKALELGDDDGDADRGADDDERRRLRARREAAARRDAGGLLRRLNPTESLLRASAFVARHEYIFALLCLLNVNMGALDLAARGDADAGDDSGDFDAGAKGDGGDYQRAVDAQRAVAAHALLHTLAKVHGAMSPDARQRVLQTVTSSGALPVSRHAAARRGHERAPRRRLRRPARLRPRVQRPRRRVRRVRVRRRLPVRADAKAEAKDREAARDAKGLPSPTAADAKATKKPSLLGDLPSFDRPPARGGRPEDDAPNASPVRLNLALPGANREKHATWMKPQPGGPRGSAKPDAEVPAEFACAINGHLLKEPARSPYGHVFEKSTITLWLETRGSVCPITGKELNVEDLEDDAALHTRLIKWHIGRMQQTMETSVSAMHGDEDDLYDF
ncbi:hypothetical protein JL722_13621 [Aureococcus anophagefferens]|nr:hypothetical protein JL722_13621 [Aureococcus anophagefferens]